MCVEGGERGRQKRGAEVVVEWLHEGRATRRRRDHGHCGRRAVETGGVVACVLGACAWRPPIVGVCTVRVW